VISTADQSNKLVLILEMGSNIKEEIPSFLIFFCFEKKNFFEFDAISWGSDLAGNLSSFG
jgi:hypothetical protein